MAEEDNNKSEIKVADLGLTYEDWDRILREVEAERQAKTLRRNNPYVLDLIRVLRPWEHGMSRRLVLDFVEKNRRRLGLPIPRTLEQTVQQSYERFCIDSDVFKKRDASESEALFCWPHGKGSGHWAIRAAYADAWLADFLAKRSHVKS